MKPLVIAACFPSLFSCYALFESSQSSDLGLLGWGFFAANFPKLLFGIHFLCANFDFMLSCHVTVLGMTASKSIAWKMGEVIKWKTSFSWQFNDKNWLGSIDSYCDMCYFKWHYFHDRFINALNWRMCFVHGTTLTFWI